MELDLKRVQYSNNDRKLGIVIPKVLSKDLAYETGIHIGDGHLGIRRRRDGWSYLHTISGNYHEELDYHKDILCPLIQRLYNKTVQPRKSTKNTVQIVYKSKAIATFKQRVLGLPSGKKTGQIKIPDLIMNSKLRNYCIQGIVDTDFFFSLRHGKYPRIVGTVPFASRTLKDQNNKNFSGNGYKSCMLYWKEV